MLTIILYYFLTNYIISRFLLYILLYLIFYFMHFFMYYIIYHVHIYPSPIWWVDNVIVYVRATGTFFNVENSRWGQLVNTLRESYSSNSCRGPNVIVSHRRNHLPYAHASPAQQLQKRARGRISRAIARVTDDIHHVHMSGGLRGY